MKQEGRLIADRESNGFVKALRGNKRGGGEQ